MPNDRMPTLVFTALALGELLLSACASGPSMPPARYQQKLRAVMDEEVATRETRDAHSRVMEEAIEGGALEDLTQPEVRAVLGKAQNCEGRELCQKAGFLPTDWYYEIGINADEDAVKQMPVLIVGFGPKGEVVRTWTLTTH